MTPAATKSAIYAAFETAHPTRDSLKKNVRNPVQLCLDRAQLFLNPPEHFERIYKLLSGGVTVALYARRKARV